MFGGFGNFGGFDDDDFFADPFERRGNDRHSSGQGGQIQPHRSRRSNDPFAAMEERMNRMMGGGMMGVGGMMGGFGDMGGGGSSQMMSFSSSSGGGGPSFSSSSTMVVSSKMGADGKMHTERYSSSAVKNGQSGAFEQQQAYNNSSTGVDRMALERRVGGRGRKMVKEYNHQSQEDRQTEYLQGMEDSEKDLFDHNWQQQVAPHMPRHSHMGGHRGSRDGAHLSLGGGGGSRRGQQRAALGM